MKAYKLNPTSKKALEAFANAATKYGMQGEWEPKEGEVTAKVAYEAAYDALAKRIAQLEEAQRKLRCIENAKRRPRKVYIRRDDEYDEE